MKKIFFILLLFIFAFVSCDAPVEPDDIHFTTHFENTNGSVMSYHPSVFYAGENVNIDVTSNKFGELQYYTHDTYSYNLVRGAKCDNGFYKYSVIIYYTPLDTKYENSRITIKLK